MHPDAREAPWQTGDQAATARVRGLGAWRAGSRAAGRVILSDCRLVDGAGNPWVAADVLVEGDLVAAIAPAGTMPRRGRPAPVVVDAGGRFVTPGFIDPHTHSDLTVLSTPGAESAVHQGVTTHVVGNCGMSAAPVDEAPHERLRDDVGELLRGPDRDLAHVRRVSRRRRDGRLRDQRRRPRGSRRPAGRRDGLRRASGGRPRARGHEAPAGRGHGRGRVRPVVGARLPAGLLLHDRGVDRARAGRQDLRRSLRHARAGRARDDRRGGRRGRAHRARVRSCRSKFRTTPPSGAGRRPARTSP